MVHIVCTRGRFNAWFDLLSWSFRSLWVRYPSVCHKHNLDSGFELSYWSFQLPWVKCIFVSLDVFLVHCYITLPNFHQHLLWRVDGDVICYMIWPSWKGALSTGYINSSLWKKWPQFRRRYFQMHFTEWKVLYFVWKLTKVCSLKSNR